MKYNLAIANIGKLLFIFLISIAWMPLSILIIIYSNGQFLQENALLAMLIMFVPPVTFLIFWLVSQKFKDTLTLTKTGIETEHHGIIEWKNIKSCSWKSLEGTNNIYIKLKNNTWLSIGPPSTWKNYSKGYADLKKFFVEIKNFRNSLSEEEKFKFNERRFVAP